MHFEAASGYTVDVNHEVVQVREGSLGPYPSKWLCYVHLDQGACRLVDKKREANVEQIARV